ncbi:MAG: hypothetical protein ACJ0RL_03815 [Porticoccaceae bacterium]
MLYDHEKDPLETVNEANNPEYRVVMTDLQKQLKAPHKATRGASSAAVTDLYSELLAGGCCQTYAW